VLRLSYDGPGKPTDCAYLVNGTAKTCGFGPKTDSLLDKMEVREKREVLDNLHEAFHLDFAKFSKHCDTHPAGEVYRCLFFFFNFEIVSISCLYCGGL